MRQKFLNMHKIYIYTKMLKYAQKIKNMHKKLKNMHKKLAKKNLFFKHLITIYLKIIEPHYK